MAYPTSLDSLSTLTGSESMSSHSSLHNEERDAIDALQAKVGVDSSVVTTSLDYRVGAVETDLSTGSNPGHTHTIEDGATDITKTATQVNAILGTEHNDDGTHDTSKVVTPSASQTLENKTLTAPAMTSPSVTSGDVNLATGLNIQVNSVDPFRTIVIPAGSMSPTTTAGCAAVATVESTTNKINYKVLDFDASTDENAFATFNMPTSYDGGTLLVSFEWTAASSTGDVIWGIKGRAFANDDAIDQAVGTAQTVTDTLIATGDVHITAETSALTLAGSPAGGQAVYLQVYRDADAGGDTLAADARLKSVIIRYRVGQYSD